MYTQLFRRFGRTLSRSEFVLIPVHLVHEDNMTEDYLTEVRFMVYVQQVATPRLPCCFCDVKQMESVWEVKVHVIIHTCRNHTHGTRCYEFE